jgi:hypothetical protein
MSLAIGAAILILGLLFLATSPAGRKVLGFVFVLIVVGVVGGVGFFSWVNQQAKEIHAQREYWSLVTERQAACEKKHPVGQSPLHDARREDCKLNAYGVVTPSAGVLE